ncbi:hypothetical protein BV378_15425 [Nostoc sp. RF31YmG]|nr:hypothetical protein BV378_15425 [Nostoc sp. RF31YmG]
MGVSPDASIAKIDDVLKNTSDDADKEILEKLKSGREVKARLPEVQQVASDAYEKRRQVVQDNALFRVDDGAADARSATQKAENQKIAAVKNAQTARIITEEVANEKIARIQLGTTKSQQKNLSNQLSLLRTYYNQGAISAEKFAEKQRELSTTQTDLEKQQAENRLAVQQAVQARRLKDIEFANKKAEAAIAKKDDIGIKSAQVGLEIAQREITLGDKRLNNALENLAAQDELASNATKAQEATQKMAVDQQVAADGARKQSDSLEKVEAKANKDTDKTKDTENSKGKKKGRPGNRIGETYVTASGRTIKDGVDITNYQYDEALNIEEGNPRALGTDPVEAIGAMKPGVPISSSLGLGLELPKSANTPAMPNLKLKPGENLFDAYQRQRDSMTIPMPDKTAASVDATKVAPSVSDRASAFGEALKIANQEVVQRLDRLVESMAAVASTPRSISISSPNPIDDAADLLSKAQRAGMRAAGI